MKITINTNGQVTKIEDSVLVANGNWLNQRSISVVLGDDFTAAQKAQMTGGTLAVVRSDGITVRALPLIKSTVDGVTSFSYDVQDGDGVFAVCGSLQVSAKITNSTGQILATVAVAAFVKENVQTEEEYNAISSLFATYKTEFTGALGTLNTHALKYYDVANIASESVSYNADGYKTAPAVYTGFSHNVAERGSASETTSKTGSLFVTHDSEAVGAINQTEIFVANDGNVYLRKIAITKSLANEAYTYSVGSTAVFSAVSSEITGYLSDNYYNKSIVDSKLALKQNNLIYDNAPTANSDNALKSGTVYNALAAKQDAATLNGIVDGKITAAVSTHNGNISAHGIDGVKNRLSSAETAIGTADIAAIAADVKSAINSLNEDIDSLQLGVVPRVIRDVIFDSEPQTLNAALKTKLSAAVTAKTGRATPNNTDAVQVIDNEMPDAGYIYTYYYWAAPTVSEIDGWYLAARYASPAITEVPSYEYALTLNSWGTADQNGYYQISITPEMHGMGSENTVDITVLKLTGGAYEKINQYDVTTTGTVNVYTDEPFVGKVVVRTGKAYHTADQTIIDTITAEKVIGLADVASSGSYNDLTDKPTIPTVGTLKTDNADALDVNASESFGGAVNLHKIAKTGTYADLIGKPSIPSKTSDITNDSGFVNDISGKLDNSHNSSATAHSDIRLEVASVRALAEQREAFTFADYMVLQSSLNSAANTAYRVGNSIYVSLLEVPDLWVYSVETSLVTAAYADNNAFLAALTSSADGTVQVGYYKLAKLETQKADLSGYVQTTRTVNGKALSSDITLASSDVKRTVNAQSNTTVVFTALPNHDEEYRYGTITSLSLLISTLTPTNSDYIFSLVFTAGTEMTVTTTDIRLTGDNCLSGSFTPTVGKHYTIIVWYDGTWQGVVRRG